MHVLLTWHVFHSPLKEIRVAFKKNSFSRFRFLRVVATPFFRPKIARRKILRFFFFCMGEIFDLREWEAPSGNASRLSTIYIIFFSFLLSFTFFCFFKARGRKETFFHFFLRRRNKYWFSLLAVGGSLV